MMYVRFPLSLRNVEDLLLERGIDICDETLRLSWTRFGQIIRALTTRSYSESELTFRELAMREDLDAEVSGRDPR